MKRNYLGLMKRPWAIVPEALTMLVAALEAGPMAAEDGGAAKPATQAGGTMLIPVQGYIVPRSNAMLEAWYGVTGISRIKAQLREAIANPSVGRIVFDVDSPGGSVEGVAELASEILAARGKKPITAVANGLMASAAYWIGSAADEIIVTPSGMVGSIGVLAVHEEVSGMLAREGVAVTLITAGKYKAEANPYEPLGEEARAAIQHEVDHFYGMFVAAVAKGRGVKPAEVRGGFGEGRVVNAAEAVGLGMADRVATFDDVLNGARGGRGRNRADLSQRRLRLAELAP
jgi:capsid assembly protease